MAPKVAARKPEEVTAADARDQLTDLMNRAGFRGERFIITKNGKPAAAIVGLADLEVLEGAA